MRPSKVSNLLWSNVKNRYWFALLALVGLVSCGALVKGYVLENGVTEVPASQSVYSNVDKFDPDLLKIVDTEAFYERYERRYDIVSRLDTHSLTSVYDTYRFYRNGCLNSFWVSRHQPKSAKLFNPDFNGKRGVYYYEDDRIKFDLFGETDERGTLGKIHGWFEFSGDTLYERSYQHDFTEIYIKRKVPEEYLQFEANWADSLTQGD